MAAQTPSAVADPYASIAAAPAAAPAAPSDNSDPYAGIATPTPATTPPETPSLGSKILGGAVDVAKGIGEGAVTGMGETIQSLPFVGKHIITPEAMAAERAYFAPSGEAEKAGQFGGQAGEAVLEFVLGDEALKGLSIAKKLGIAEHIADISTKSPYIAKLLEHGTLAARQGTVGTTSALAHGATLPHALEIGAFTAEAAFVAKAAEAAPVAEAAASRLKFPNPFRAAANKLLGKDIQPMLQGGIRDVWNNVAAAEGVPKPLPGISVGEMGEQVGDSIYARSKAAYAEIDKATGNRFSGNEESLRTVNKALRFVTNDTEEQNLLIRRTRLEMQADEMFDEAAKKGVSKDTVAKAKADFKKAQAIYDTNAQIQASTTGVRPGKTGSMAVPEEVNAKSLMNRANKLYNKGRLQEAIGDDNSEDLIGHTARAQKMARDVARNRAVAKWAVPAAVTGAAGAAYELAK